MLTHKSLQKVEALPDEAFVNENGLDSIVVTKGAYYVNTKLNRGEFTEHEH